MGLVQGVERALVWEVMERLLLRANSGLALVLLALASVGALPDSWPLNAILDPSLWWLAAGALTAALTCRIQNGPAGWSAVRVWLIVPMFVFNASGVAAVVTLLSPAVIDPILLDLDRSLLFGLSATPDLGQTMGLLLGNLASAWPLIPLAVLFWLRRNRAEHAVRFLTALMLVGTIAWGVHLFAPAAGPAAWQANDPVPVQALVVVDGDPATQSEISQALAHPAPRNGVPPMPMAWLALAALAARGLGRLRFWTTLGLAGLMAVTSVCSGRYGLIPTLTSVPLALACWPLAERAARFLAGKPARLGLDGIVLGLAPLVLGLGTFLLWKKGLFHPLAFWVLLAACTALTLRASGRCLARLREGGEVPHKQAPDPSDETSDSRPTGGTRFGTILALFFCSGLTGLVYEVVFERELALLFGSTARASITVLAVYMSGLALGAFFGGRLTDRVRKPLRFYALAEAGVGVICLLAPYLFDLADGLYLWLAANQEGGHAFSTGTETAIQVACGSLVVLLPAVLMGTTMPLLAKHATTRLTAVRRNVALLYSANTLGAACGTLLAAYWAIATLGIDGSLRLATLINFAVAGAALLLARSSAPLTPPPAKAKARLTLGGGFGVSLLLAAFGVGFICFALEVTWVHLLAVVAGTSVYAFGLMLFAFLAGLGLGSILISRWPIAEHLGPARLAASLLALGACVLILLPLWDKIPPHFGLYGQVRFADTFAQREFVRFAVCFGMMFVPTLLIGMIFPQLVSLSARSVDSLGRHLGLVSFSNTLGNIVGAIGAGLLLIPFLGSYRSIQLLGLAALVLGIGMALWSPGRPRRWLLALGSGGLLLGLIALPAGWNLSALTMGTNVYFAYQPFGELVELRESLDGGMSTIARIERDGRSVTTMLTNGKFQGDDHHEMGAQAHFALYPLLHCQARERALVIGLGTGVTARVLAEAGFGQVMVAELSEDLVDLAKRYFAHVNGQVLTRASTITHVTDGRNLLKVRPESYDLISMEVSSIWFAGAANLYNQEFYQLARSRLKPAGVLQQWIQLHHISPEDIASILATLRSVFPHVHLYWGGAQGVLVASANPLELDWEYLHGLEAQPSLAKIRALMPGDSLLPLAGELLLSSEGIDRYLLAIAARGAESPSSMISTDRNRRLEYSTPKGNVRPHGMLSAVKLLRKLGGPAPVPSTKKRTAPQSTSPTATWPSLPWRAILLGK